MSKIRVGWIAEMEIIGFVDGDNKIGSEDLLIWKY
jgi:hypothetical protein